MLIANYHDIHAQIVELLELSRRAAARTVNAVMTATYWEVGRRIIQYEQAGAHRAAYGDELLLRLSADLTKRFGRGFSRQNIQQMRNFYLFWPEINQTPSGKFELPWSAYVKLLSVSDANARTFYEIQHMADFQLELGDDFAFVGRQRRLRLDDTWFRIDLLFFHRRLKCLVVIELKTGRFNAGDAGQMHLYLNYAREHWTKPDENPPVGLILCAGKGAAEARYALDKLPNQIIAADYHMLLPDEKLLTVKLRDWCAYPHPLLT